MNVNAPFTGVCPGSSRCHGPNDPSVAICPGGTPFVSNASNGMVVFALTECTRSVWRYQVFGVFSGFRGMMITAASGASTTSITTCRPAET